MGGVKCTLPYMVVSLVLILYLHVTMLYRIIDHCSCDSQVCVDKSSSHYLTVHFAWPFVQSSFAWHVCGSH